MKIAQQLKEKNIAEYLIYMWQIEDLIRANDCDVDRIEENIVSRYQVSDEERRELTEWYANLASMMREEGVREKGHLQINRNVIINLTELHAALLASPKFPFYCKRSRSVRRLRRQWKLSVAFCLCWPTIMIRIEKES